MPPATNEIFTLLPPQERTDLERQCSLVQLRYRMRLQSTGRPIDHIYFPVAGVVSLVGVNVGRRYQAEVGMIGRDGLVGASILSSAFRSPLDAIVQVEGAAYKIDVEKLMKCCSRCAAVEQLLRRFSHCLNIQVAQTAVANAKGLLDQRLARFLLMCQDRLGSQVHLTHEAVAFSLGVRRAGVTAALHSLQSDRLVEVNRRSIEVIDRPRLVELAAGLYGVPETEYRSIVGCGCASHAPRQSEEAAQPHH